MSTYTTHPSVPYSLRVLFSFLKSLNVGGALLLLAFVSPAVADDTAFDQWMLDLRAEARSVGISEATLDAALTGVKPAPKVVKLDRNQPEFKLTFQGYKDRMVTPWRKQTAAKKLIEHAEILDAVERKYGVQKRYIVTFWGMETNFGGYMGKFHIPQALVTLAYDGRRSSYFRKELLNALRIIEDGHIKAEDMIGSWAGAMGQSQFMPSSFLNYAVDWDGDGRRDIWSTEADVFASAANYLSKAGWRDDITWGRQVSLPKGFSLKGMDASQLEKKKMRLPLPAWAEAGVINPDGSALPTRPLKARLVLPDDEDGPAYLVYSNFESILRWNRSDYYALAIGHLSDTLR